MGGHRGAVRMTTATSSTYPAGGPVPIAQPLPAATIYSNVAGAAGGNAIYEQALYPGKEPLDRPENTYDTAIYPPAQHQAHAVGKYVRHLGHHAHFIEFPVICLG